MANARGKSVDSTYLDVEQINRRGILHRDYIAHTFRWSHVLRHLRPNCKERIVDAGCGVLAPMAKVLYTNRQTNHKYLGVDIGPIDSDIDFNGAFQPVFWPNTDICDTRDYDIQKTLGGDPTLVTGFEFLEHVEPDHAVRILRRLFDIACPDGELLISTPCYDPKVGPADHHVNEWSYEGLGTTFEMVGFTVKNHWGTFASQKDYKQYLSPAEEEVYKKLHEYYDSNVLAVVMAPLHPEHARNVLWHLDTRGGAPRDADAPWRINLLDAWQRRVLGSSTNEAAWLAYGEMFGFR